MDAENQKLRSTYKQSVLQEIACLIAFFLMTTTSASWLIYFVASDRFYRGYVVRNIDREVYQKGHVAAKSHDTSPPLVQVLNNEDSARGQLEQCGIEFRKNEPFGFCLGATYISHQYVGLISTMMTPSPLRVWRSFRYRTDDELSPRHIELTSELAVALGVTHQLNLSRDKIERKKIQYCMAGGASSLANAKHPQIKDFMIRDLRKVARQTIDDISPNEQVAAFEKGWSGEACY